MPRCYEDVAIGSDVPCAVYVGLPELPCPFGVTCSILIS